VITWARPESHRVLAQGETPAALVGARQIDLGLPRDDDQGRDGEGDRVARVASGVTGSAGDDWGQVGAGGGQVLQGGPGQVPRLRRACRAGRSRPGRVGGSRGEERPASDPPEHIAASAASDIGSLSSARPLAGVVGAGPPAADRGRYLDPRLPAKRGNELGLLCAYAALTPCCLAVIHFDS
jgi:hypothetical protein